MAGDLPGKGKTRGTYWLDTNLINNAKLLALKEGKSSRDVLEEALVSHLKNKGLDDPMAKTIVPWPPEAEKK